MDPASADPASARAVQGRWSRAAVGLLGALAFCAVLFAVDFAVNNGPQLPEVRFRPPELPGNRPFRGVRRRRGRSCRARRTGGMAGDRASGGRGRWACGGSEVLARRFGT